MISRVRPGQRRWLLALGGAVVSAAVSGCENPVIADADGQAIIYGSAAVEGGGPGAGVAIDGVVYKQTPCGSEYGAAPFHTETDSTGLYRVHVRILTRDPFWGCVEVVGVDPALGLTSETVTEERVYFDIAEPFDSVRMDVILR